MFRSVKVLLLAALAQFAATVTIADDFATAPLRTDHLVSRLVAAQDALVPGQPLQLGLLLQHDPHWHTYWKNPGDSGLPTVIELTLPEGFSAGGIQWPLPERLPFGDLTNFGYSDTVLLPITVAPPATIDSHSVTIKAHAEWLVCREACIPGKGDYTLTLPVNSAAKPVAAWADYFARSLQRQSQNAPQDFKAEYRIDGADLTLRFTGAGVPADISQWQLFPAVAQVMANTAQPRWQREDNGWSARIAKSEYFSEAPQRMELLLAKGDRGITVDMALNTQAAAVPVQRAANNEAVTGVLIAVPLALLGGLLLNLMPCVFPVLFLKAAGALEAAADRAKLRRHGLFYTLGVVSSFMAVAAVLLALRASGSALGWGFQLQEPWFVAAMALLLFVMGLSFSGLVEIGARFAGAGQGLTERAGDAGAFFTGVLACVVASPCTAPFMGTALGFALTRSPVEALSVFAALGLGLALPMLALGFVPGFAKLLPRPGAWMENLRQLLAFPLYLTVVWLLWVYGEQTSALGMAQLLLALVGVAFALWLLGRAAHIRRDRYAHSVRIAAGLLLLAAIAWPLVKSPELVAAPTRHIDAAAHEPWSADKLQALRAQGRPVLVNMTAAWCITCLANERVALSSQAFAQAMEKHQVAYLKGDWTRHDPQITAYLESFGRSGVPLYVLYPAQAGREPIVLPQLLTPAIVQEALNAL